ncbi:MAG: hypothetical protein COV02_02375 [Candidatus Terrybacteria bacterium CG10_big_fil_rev_8_21_14_0_10_41_10]|uniref:DUF86 domain-containing protein n=1 Tax=Candidatus Terrybacteria bacterium CG10_big_fil_rev_8_21_14_0_10_41_10 TaxID=1975026 RepID=A0A2M8LA25_9BACT|nr:MAG: hypothetical protein COV02_02375 [Candidatus Terrybacteria bacterium CG10_big_fil_rev_8_21_14_0_10_41_10]
MTNLSVIENKISSIKKYLNIIERYKIYSREEIENNIDIKGAIERYLYLVAQATIDLAEAIISFKNFRKPSTMSESFYILEENNIISKDLTQKMVGMTGFRNAVAHDYEKINYDLVYKIIHRDIKDIENFIEIASKVY